MTVKRRRERQEGERRKADGWIWDSDRGILYPGSRIVWGGFG